MTEPMENPEEEIMNEIAGGLKNALERGDNLEHAKISFLNAGYAKDEIEKAAASIGSPKTQALIQPVQQIKPLVPIQPIQPLVSSRATEPLPKKKSFFGFKKLDEQKLPHTNAALPTRKEVKQLPLARPDKPKSTNKALVIVLILLGIILILMAGFLGVYWDQLFGPF
jgi:hypothetical protein